MRHWIDTARHWSGDHKQIAIGIGVAAALLLVYVLLRLYAAGARAMRRLGRFGKGVQAPKWKPEDVLTVLIALTATVYAGSGNWKFLGSAMHYGAGLKLVLVWVFEGAVVVEGLRARRNIKMYGKAGKDGVGLWVLAWTSALLSVSESGSVQEALGRLVVPIIAAFLWERLLESDLDAAALEKAKARREAIEALTADEPTGRIRWRIRPERIAVWLRLADAADTTVSALESNRKVMRYLKATDRTAPAVDGQARPGLLPWTAAARADRAERKLAAHALLHHGNPADVHAALAKQQLAKALTRLGVDLPQSNTGSDESTQEPAVHPEESITESTHTRFTPEVDTSPIGFASEADAVDIHVESDADAPHIRFTYGTEAEDTSVYPIAGAVLIPAQASGVDFERIHSDEADADDTSIGDLVDMSTDAGAGQVDGRPDAETAKAIIFAGWSNGTKASTIIRQSGRSRSFVYRELKALDDKHGTRLRPEDTGEIPAMTAANGFPLHEAEADGQS